MPHGKMRLFYRGGLDVTKKQCRICGFESLSETAIKLHVKTKHGIENPQMEKHKNQCSKCGVLFHSKAEGQRHYYQNPKCL